MNTSTTANTGKQVANIVYSNLKKEVVSFKRFVVPLPNNEVKPEEIFTEPFAIAIVQFTDGTAYTFNNKIKKS